MAATTPAHVTIRILSQPRYLGAVRAAVEATAEQLGFDDTERGRIVLAVDEAVSNVIRHGYHGREDGLIQLRLWPVRDGRRDGMEILIEDECEGIDLAGIRSRALEDVRPGGLGVHILQQVMDEAQYSHRADRTGLALRLRKYRCV